VNYVKSALVGVAAVLLICGVLPLLVTIAKVFAFFVRHGGEGGIAIGPAHWYVPSLAEWLSMSAVFGIGFLWKLRRLTKKMLQPPANPTDLPKS